MPKIRETKDAYIVEPSFMESLGPALNSLAEAFVKKQLLDQKKKKDQEEAELEQAKWELQLAELSKTDPEKATELQNLPAVAKILDPLRIEKLKHENESLFTKYRHRKEHEALKGTPFPKGTELGFPLLAAQSLTAPGSRPDYKVSPQLQAAREKAADEARKAGTEADLAEAKTGETLAGLYSGNIATKMVVQGLDPGNPTAVMAFLKKHKDIETKYESEVPGTESFISKKAADLAGDLLKEYPGGNAKDLQAFARSVYTGENLPADVRKRLGESQATKKLKLDERAQRSREAEVTLSRERQQFERNKATFETTQNLVNNGMDPAVAGSVAASIIKTGQAPEGVTVPEDLLKKAQQLKLTDDHIDAQVRSPKFNALNAMAQRTPEGPARNNLIQQMYTEMCKGPGTNCPTYEKPMPWYEWVNTQVGKNYKEALEGYWKLGAKAAAIGSGVAAPVVGGAVKYGTEAASTIGEAVGGAFTGAPTSKTAQPPVTMTPSLISDPRAALPTPEAPAKLTPEISAKADQAAAALEETFQNPNIPEMAKTQLAKIAGELAAAMKSGNAAEIMRVLASLGQK
jgi:hypothetical protein